MRLALVAFIAVTINSSWGPDFAKAAFPPQAPKAKSQSQDRSQSGNQPNPAGAKEVARDYLIGPSDVLVVNVWKDTELTRTVLVRPDGKISLPLVGELPVSGLTALEVQNTITQRLKEYIGNPQVTVIVQEVKSRTYDILGKIVKPGSYDLGKPTNVLDAIAIAGGFLDFAKPDKIYIMRRQENGSVVRLPFDYKSVIKGRKLEENIDLKSGDTIVVP